MQLTLKPAYLSKIEEHGVFTIWDVNGAYRAIYSAYGNDKKI